jgi:hypothetical protein
VEDARGGYSGSSAFGDSPQEVRIAPCATGSDDGDPDGFGYGPDESEVVALHATVLVDG